MRPPAEEIRRRFLLHVLPDGFQRVRHYGFLSNRAKNHALPRCRALLGTAPSPTPPYSPAGASSQETILALTGVDTHRCPACGSPTFARVGLFALERFAPIRGPPAHREVR
ncbi:MAG: transposase [Deferrisomatales bacterium]